MSYIDEITELAKDEAQFCKCAGPTCSGCGAITIKTFKTGAQAALKTELVKDIVTQLNLLKNCIILSTNTRSIVEKTNSLLADYREATK